MLLKLCEEPLRLALLSGRQVRWAVESGLGPLLYYAARDDPDGPKSPYWPTLQSADLTSRVLAAFQQDALDALLDACTTSGIPVAILKGVSLSERYPLPHLRLMRDIDVLVEADDVDRVCTACRSMGYRDDPSASPVFYAGHHHAAPLVHPATGIFIEVHHALFPATRTGGPPDPFSPGQVRSHLVDAQLRGRPVRRLSTAMELTYLSSHFARSLKPILHPGGVVPLVDLRILMRSMDTREWDDVLGMVTATQSAIHLRAVAGYLVSRGLAAMPVSVERLFDRLRPRLSTWQLEVLWRVVDWHVVEGWRPLGQLGVTPVEHIWRRWLHAAK